MTTTISSQPISKDTVVTITPTQLKTTNLIFAEHEKLSLKVPLLESKIVNLETINANWLQVDSLRSAQISLYTDVLKGKENEISSLKKSIKKSRVITGGSILITVVLALVCALK